MKDILIALFGEYDYSIASSTIEDGSTVYLNSICYLDWTYIFGVVIFCLFLFLVFRILASTLKWCIS